MYDQWEDLYEVIEKVTRVNHKLAIQNRRGKCMAAHINRLNFGQPLMQQYSDQLWADEEQVDKSTTLRQSIQSRHCKT